MRKFYYYQFTPDDGHHEVAITDETIIETYWPFWQRKMKEKYGDNDYLITQENCIADWIVINWAFEKEHGGEG
jgi:hypothetical protein